MQLTIQCFGILKDYFPAKFQVEIPTKSKAATILEELKTQEPKAAFILNHCRIALSDRIVALDFLVEKPTTILIFPPSSGG